MINLFVSNLSQTVSEQHIRELFQHFGAVGDVQVIMSNETGRSQKFAFVEMANRHEGETALSRLHNMQFMGFYLEVKEVRNKEDKK